MSKDINIWNQHQALISDVDVDCLGRVYVRQLFEKLLNKSVAVIVWLWAPCEEYSAAVSKARQMRDRLSHYEEYKDLLFLKYSYRKSEHQQTDYNNILDLLVCSWFGYDRPEIYFIFDEDNITGKEKIILDRKTRNIDVNLKHRIYPYFCCYRDGFEEEIFIENQSDISFNEILDKELENSIEKFKQRGERKVLVYRADVSTGHILNNDGSTYLNKGDNYYIVFTNIEDARKYIKEYLEKDKSVEFLIKDHDGNSLEHIMPDIKHIPTPEKEGDFLNRLWKRIRNRSIMEMHPLNKGQFSVFITEIETGIVLNSDKSRYLSEGSEYYKIFNSLEEARIYSLSYTENDSSVECVVYNSEGEYIETINSPLSLKSLDLFNTVLKELGENEVLTNSYFHECNRFHNYLIKYKFQKEKCIQFDIEFNSQGVALDIDRASKIIQFNEKQLDYKENEFVTFIHILFLSTIRIEYIGENYTRISFFNDKKQLEMKLGQKRNIWSFFSLKKEAYEYTPIFSIK